MKTMKMSTYVVLAGGIAFVAFTIVDILFYFVGNALLKPLIEIIDRTPISFLSEIGAMPWVIYAIWAFLLIFESIAILSFVAIVARSRCNGCDTICH